MFFSAISAISAVSSVVVDAQASKTRAHVETLASPRLEGRLAGSNGEKLASDYIVAELQKIGAKPLPGQTGLPAAVRVHGRHEGRRIDDQRAARRRRRRRRRRSVHGSGSVRALSFSDNGDVEGAGRLRRLRHRRARQPGLRLRQLRHARREGQDRRRPALLPEDAEPKTKGILVALRRPPLQGDGRAAARREGDDRRHRTDVAERRRAGADDVRHGDRRLRHRRGQRHRRGRERRSSRPSPDKPLATAQKALDDANPHATGFALPGVTVRVHAAVEREKRTGHNVVALPAGDDAGDDGRQAVGRARRALRSPRPRRSRQHAGRQGRRGQDPLRRRRQRVGIGRRPRDRGDAGEAAAQAQRARRLLVGRGARADRLERVLDRRRRCRSTRSPRT